MRTLLQRIDASEDRVTLIPTDRDRLRTHTFLDGRSDFSSGPFIESSVTEWSASLPTSPVPDRYIFHVGFCGSTFLTRLLDRPGCALVLREPNCLADLANRGHRADILDLVRRHLRFPWADGEAVVVKPSNWANSLLREMSESTAPMLPVFLHMSRVAFLQAVLRGGNRRIAFAARAAVHLSGTDDRDALLVSRALEADANDELRLARLALVALDIQVRMFSYASAIAGWGKERWLTHDDLTQDPVAAAKRMATALAIELSTSEIEQNVLLWKSRHAKSAGDEFDFSTESASNEALRLRYGNLMEAALSWADANLPPTAVQYVANQ